jgi:mannose-6-phosphate isomerase-like protein (cupin superfamily)
MEVKNFKNCKYFTSIDSCKITELFGIPTLKLKEVSLAYAILPKGKKTDEHLHKFLEIYVIAKGKGIMQINNKKEKILEGDSILIPKNSHHCIENSGNKNLEFYCICVPSFTEKGTVMKKLKK